VVSIFVSVASYRDPELVPTVLDCLAKAASPDELRIVVNWQHLGDEDVSALRDDPRVTILEFDARQSRGACWARARIQQHYVDSDWYLQVDSHTRFVPGWDERLVAIAERTGAAKPIVTAYPAAYDPAQELDGAAQPTAIVLSGWTADGLPEVGQVFLTGEQQPPKPVRARFLAAGFLFAPGTFVREVRYDEKIYFMGEEINLATRAFTHGYDLFHPAEILAWHYYVRGDAPHHWDDHATAEEPWYELDRAGRRRVRTLLTWPMFGELAQGEARTMADYQAYAGIDFQRRTAEDAARLGIEPAAPVPR
jgi:hypothetical protein